MVSGPSHGCGGQGENIPEASPFESELRAKAQNLLKEFEHRIINPYFQCMAEQFDAEMRKLLK